VVKARAGHRQEGRAGLAPLRLLPQPFAAMRETATAAIRAWLPARETRPRMQGLVRRNTGHRQAVAPTPCPRRDRFRRSLLLLVFLLFGGGRHLADQGDRTGPTRRIQTVHLAGVRRHGTNEAPAPRDQLFGRNYQGACPRARHLIRDLIRFRRSRLRWSRC
jgi:hypothetical protein